MLGNEDLIDEGAQGLEPIKPQSKAEAKGDWNKKKLKKNIKRKPPHLI